MLELTVIKLSIMKKIFILIGFVVFFSMQAAAQGGFRIGVKGGLNLNKVNGNKPINLRQTKIWQSARTRNFLF